MSDSTVFDRLLSGPSGAHWQKVGLRKRFGVAVPLSSLKSHRDVGVGDVGDIEALARWCRRIGASVIQLLPIADMGDDCVPYSAMSAFAIDPIFTALDDIEGASGDPAFDSECHDAGARFADAVMVDFQKVRRVKLDLLKRAFDLVEGPQMRQTLAAYRTANGWLEDYLPYRVIKEIESFRSWLDWDERWRPSVDDGSFEAEHGERMVFFTFVQWLLDRQFTKARDTAHSLGILLEGDIPILVARDSADVWRNQHLFNMDRSAGAPPDMYAADGQNWGFPTYAWHEHRKNDYSWWRRRLKRAQNWFDLYRIDHVVGFFRIWTIPVGEQTGKNGWFDPWDEAVWGDHGRTILMMMLGATTLLPLAEDLGTIPDICRSTLTDLGICGFKVQRWERRWHGDQKFIPPMEYPELSMATVSTHDSEILAHWWEMSAPDRQEIWQMMGREGEAPTVLDQQTHLAVLTWIQDSSALFVVQPLQELLGACGKLPGHPSLHRVNIPGLVNDTNWRWRSPAYLEDMLADDSMNAALRATVPDGR